MQKPDTTINMRIALALKRSFAEAAHADGKPTLTAWLIGLAQARIKAQSRKKGKGKNE